MKSRFNAVFAVFVALTMVAVPLSLCPGDEAAAGDLTEVEVRLVRLDVLIDLIEDDGVSSYDKGSYYARYDGNKKLPAEIVQDKGSYALKVLVSSENPLVTSSLDDEFKAEYDRETITIDKGAWGSLTITRDDACNGSKPLFDVDDDRTYEFGDMVLLRNAGNTDGALVTVTGPGGATFSEGFSVDNAASTAASVAVTGGSATVSAVPGGDFVLKVGETEWSFGSSGDETTTVTFEPGNAPEVTAGHAKMAEGVCTMGSWAVSYHDGDSVTVVHVFDGAEAPLDPLADTAEKTFVGWFDAVSGGEAISSLTAVGDTDVYAVWIPAVVPEPEEPVEPSEPEGPVVPPEPVKPIEPVEPLEPQIPVTPVDDPEVVDVIVDGQTHRVRIGTAVPVGEWAVPRDGFVLSGWNVAGDFAAAGGSVVVTGAVDIVSVWTSATGTGEPSKDQASGSSGVLASEVSNITGAVLATLMVFAGLCVVRREML